MDANAADATAASAPADATAASSAPSDPAPTEPAAASPAVAAAAAEPAAASPAVPAAPLKRAADVRQGIALVLETIRAAPPDEAFTVFAILNYQHSDDAAPRQGRWRQLEKPLRFSCTARELADIAALSRFGLAVDFLNHHHQAPGASQPWMEIATRVLDGGPAKFVVAALTLGHHGRLGGELPPWVTLDVVWAVTQTFFNSDASDQPVLICRPGAMVRCVPGRRWWDDLEESVVQVGALLGVRDAGERAPFGYFG